MIPQPNVFGGGVNFAGIKGDPASNAALVAYIAAQSGGSTIFANNEILFGNGTSTPAQDPTLTWDNTNKIFQLSYDATNHTSFTENSTSGLKINPGVDSTSALNVTKADGSTTVLNVDSTNGFVAVGNNTAPTAFLDVAPATFTNASLRLRTTGATPFTTNSGDIWQDGTHCYMIIGTTKYQLDNPPGGLNFKEIATSAGSLVANTIHYITNASVSVVLNLPSTFNENDYFGIVAKGAGGFTIKQVAGQTIHIKSTATTTGAGNTITSTQQYTYIGLRGTATGTDLAVVDIVGNFNAVTPAGTVVFSGAGIVNVDYQAAGNYITALTGDGTASGPGSSALTLATVNSSIGTYNNVTVNSKGLVTGASNISYQSAYSNFTANQVLFGNGTSTPVQDSNLFWDNTNKRLGLGTTSPASLLSVGSTSQFQVDSSGNASINSKLNLYGTSPPGSPADAGFLFNTNASFPSGSFTEVGGNVLSYGINAPQIGTRSTGTVGGIFRLDTRNTNNEFSVFGYPAGGSSAVQAISASLSAATPTVAIGNTAWTAYTSSNGGTLTVTSNDTTIKPAFSLRQLSSNYGFDWDLETLSVGRLDMYAMVAGTRTLLMSYNRNGANVSIGANTFPAMFNVGTANQFQVNSSGNIVELNGVATNFPATQGAANTYLKNDGAGNLTWASTTLPTVEVTTTSFTLAQNTRYIINTSTLCTLTLPTTFFQGAQIIIDGKGTGGWKVTQNAGQTIHSTSDTTTGTAGSIASTARYDNVALVGITANTDLEATARNGSLVLT